MELSEFLSAIGGGAVLMLIYYFQRKITEWKANKSGVVESKPMTLEEAYNTFVTNKEFSFVVHEMRETNKCVHDLTKTVSELVGELKQVNK